jgi:tetratricopeptide (TPR) repeat protein
MSQEIGDKRNATLARGNIGGVLRIQGDLAGARQMFEQALATSRESRDKSATANALNGIAAVLADQGRLAEARKWYEDALAIQREIGEKTDATATQLALVELTLEGGRPAEAEPLARQAAEMFHTQKALDHEAAANAVLARSLFDQGRLLDAQSAIERATALSGKGQNRLDRLPLAIMAGRIRASSVKPAEVAEAVKTLRGLLEESTRLGYIGYQFETRLVLGEIEMRSGKTAAGRAGLAALENEATAKNFLLMARKAHAVATAR